MSKIDSKKTITTKALAQALGVDVRTVFRTAEKLGYDSTVTPLETAGGTQNVRVFDEEQATAIKLEIQKHHNLAKRQIDNVSSDLEIIGNAIMAFDALKKLYSQKEEEMKATIESQKKRLLVTEPKAKWFDNVAESTNLIDFDTEAKKCGFSGKIKFIRVLLSDKIIFRKCVAGVEFFLPYSQYTIYFKSVPVPFQKGGAKYTRPKLMFTQKGGQWIEAKFDGEK